MAKFGLFYFFGPGNPAIQRDPRVSLRCHFNELAETSINYYRIYLRISQEILKVFCRILFSIQLIRGSQNFLLKITFLPYLDSNASMYNCKDKLYFPILESFWHIFSHSTIARGSIYKRVYTVLEWPCSYN